VLLVALLFPSYLPIPTSQSRTIRLSGTPKSHMITYAIRTPSVKYSSMAQASLVSSSTLREHAGDPSFLVWPVDRSVT
jgi:hypothetical protein